MVYGFKYVPFYSKQIATAMENRNSWWEKVFGAFWWEFWRKNLNSSNQTRSIQLQNPHKFHGKFQNKFSIKIQKLFNTLPPHYYTKPFHFNISEFIRKFIKQKTNNLHVRMCNTLTPKRMKICYPNSLVNGERENFVPKYLQINFSEK